jgi:hypothetical protein
MTNEMKLITALCDALGFEVEKACVNKESLDRYTCQLNRLMAMSSESYMQHNMLGEVKAIYEYKLTKRIEKELTPDEKAVEDYILRNEAMLTKRVESKIPKKFIDDNLKKAKGSTMFDIPLEDLTKEELMCCVVASWDDEKKTRAAAINQNRLDLARFFWGKES